MKAVFNVGLKGAGICTKTEYYCSLWKYCKYFANVIHTCSVKYNIYFSINNRDLNFQIFELKGDSGSGLVQYYSDPVYGIRSVQIGVFRGVKGNIQILGLENPNIGISENQFLRFRRVLDWIYRIINF